MSSYTLDMTRSQEETLRQEMVNFLPRLRRFARSLAKDPDKADDLVQDACERALDRLSHVRAGTRLDSWLYRIIYPRWIDNIRRNKTRAAKLVVLADANKIGTVGREVGDYLDTAMDIQKAFETLPAEHQAAVALVSKDTHLDALMSGSLRLCSRAAVIRDMAALTITMRPSVSTIIIPSLTASTISLKWPLRS